ncbi:SagB family peptide dehydrogenase [Flexivirga caeni]|uniref:SagB/ThcOx family dehydrogenase n=1 Tax=Flexivirga caeni TaxID=2294115 RepID=A0A3M9M7C5_9MICO|nr:SagB family peptide dehydrogenase [Flexivirga caeni]RNI21117.1 SagB/ThcOx family dehydrogenase [Flexivirga caeni]
MSIVDSPPQDRLSMRPGVDFAPAAPGQFLVRHRERPILRVSGVSDQLRTRLCEIGPIPTDLLIDQELRAEFDRLTAPVRRCVVHGAYDGEVLIAVAESLRTDLERIPPVPVPDGALIRHSKFAYSHRADDEVRCESPAAGARVIALDDRVRELIAASARAIRVEELLDRVPSLPKEAARQVLALLYGTGFLEVAADPFDPASFPSDTDPVLRQWDFHDLLFHSRSRYGRTTEPFGGIFPYVDEIDPEPAVRARHDGPVVDLPRPDFEEVLQHDPSVLLAMETRHSCRTFGAQPLDLQQLGEFLFRTCRIRDVYGPLPGMPYEGSKRPYPTGGAAYELEVYLTVQRVAGLESASYHYEPDAHRLRKLATSAADRAELIEAASVSAGGDVDPDVLLTITSRFQRLQWKYRSMAYAVSLKHAGVLYQTFYLVASAMKIGACGLGSGNAQTSVRAFGLDYLRESSIGEFLIGSAPEGSRSLHDLPEVDLRDQEYPGQDWSVRSAQRRS